MTPHSQIPIESLARASITLASEVLAGITHSSGSGQQDVLTLADAAELLRVPETAVRQLVASGEVPGRLIGGEWRLLRSTIMSWLSGVDCRQRVRTASGWQEDASYRKIEQWSPPSDDPWSAASSKEAEEFIQQIHASRRESVENPSDEDSGE